MTPQEFGATVQAKYPQYSNLPPEQVAQLVVQKYPQYQSQITPEQAQGNNFFQNLIQDPIKELLVQPAVRAYQAGQALFGTITGNEHLASAGERDVNLNLGPLGNMNIPALKPGLQGLAQVGGSALKTAAYLAPGLGEGGLLAQTGKNALAGAAFGSGNALEQNAPGSEVLKQGLTGAAIGGAIGAAGYGVQQGVETLTKTLPEKLMNSVMPPTLNEMKRALNQPDYQTLSQWMVQKGMSGDYQSLLDLANTGLQKNEDALQSILQNSDATVTRSSLSKYLEPLVTKITDTPLERDFNKIVGVLDSFPKEVPIAEANVIKRKLYDILGEKAYWVDASLSTERDAIKALARGIKTEIENATKDSVVPGTQQNLVQAINRDLSMYGRLRDRTMSLLAKEAKKSGLSLTDLFTLGAGVASGHGLLGVAADAAEHVYNSPGVKSKIAIGLTQAGTKSISPVVSSSVRKGLLAASTKRTQSKPVTQQKSQLPSGYKVKLI